MSQTLTIDTSIDYKTLQEDIKKHENDKEWLKLNYKEIMTKLFGSDDEMLRSLIHSDKKYNKESYDIYCNLYFSLELGTDFCHDNKTIYQLLKYYWNSNNISTIEKWASSNITNEEKLKVLAWDYDLYCQTLEEDQEYVVKNIKLIIKEVTHSYNSDLDSYLTKLGQTIGFQNEEFLNIINDVFISQYSKNSNIHLPLNFYIKYLSDINILVKDLFEKGDQDIIRQILYQSQYIKDPEFLKEILKYDNTIKYYLNNDKELNKLIISLSTDQKLDEIKLLFNRLTSLNENFKFQKQTNRHHENANTLTLLHHAEYHKNEELMNTLLTFSTQDEINIFNKTKFLSGLAPTQQTKGHDNYCDVMFKVNFGAIKLTLEYNSVDEFYLIENKEEYYLLHTRQINGFKTMCARSSTYTIPLSTKKIHFIAIEKPYCSEFRLSKTINLNIKSNFISDDVYQLIDDDKFKLIKFNDAAFTKLNKKDNKYNFMNKDFICGDYSPSGSSYMSASLERELDGYEEVSEENLKKYGFVKLIENIWIHPELEKSKYYLLKNNFILKGNAVNVPLLCVLNKMNYNKSVIEWVLQKDKDNVTFDCKILWNEMNIINNNDIIRSKTNLVLKYVKDKYRNKYFTITEIY